MDSELLTTLTDLLARFGGRLAGSVAILVVGLFLARRVARLSKRVGVNWKLDETGIRFLGNIAYYLLSGVVVLIAVNNLGVEISAILAALGAVGLAVGLALTGAVTNLAAGMLIAILRPFSIGDHIVTGDSEGEVIDIDVFNTTLVTLDNETVVVPNADVVGDQITNYSTREFVRVEVPLSVSVDADLEDVARAMMASVAECSRALPEPAPEVQIRRFGKRAVEIQLEVSALAKDREDVIFEINRALSGPYRAGNWAPRYVPDPGRQ